MKQLMQWCCLLCVYFVTIQASAQTGTNLFKIAPEHPAPGSQCTIYYRNQTISPNGKVPVRCVIYTYNNFQWKADDLPLAWKDTAWFGTYQLQPNASLISCIFMTDSLTDKGGAVTYTWLLDNGKGKQMPGAFVAWGTMRNPSFARTTPFQVDSSAWKNDEVTRMWLRYEARDHESSRPVIFKDALTLYKKANEDGDSITDANIRKEIGVTLTLPNLTEQVYLDAQFLYANILHDKKAADSLEPIILEKYPLGILARDKAILSTTREPDLNKKNKTIEQLLEDFPPAKFPNVHTQISDLYYSKLFRSLIYTPIMKDSNYHVLYKYLPLVPTDALSTLYHHMVEIPHEQKKMPLPVLMGLADKIFAEMMSRPADGVYSPAQWKAYNLQMNNFVFYTHATLLYENNQPAKALEMATQLVAVNNYKKAAFNDLYVRLLLANKKNAAVKPYLLASARENALSPYMLDLLKKDYVAKNKSDKGFEQWLNSLQSKEVLATHQQELTESLINREIAPFRLESAKGGMRDLKEMKGKIVVLDFWATWCAPCKAAMPGMQLAVNKYKADKNVAFYFVATQETQANYKEMISKFIAEKKYTFEVLYDGYNNETKHLDEAYARYAKDYSISGIPMKMIIDQQGKLRWLNVGFFGSPSALSDEISFIIETLKKEASGTKATGTTAISAENNKPADASNKPAATKALPSGTTQSSGTSPAATVTAVSKPMMDAQSAAALATPHPYDTSAVEFYSHDNSIRFAGTLTLPASGPAAKAVVLVSGTGKQDRDGTMAGHKLFAVLADYLTRNGIAVLRVDDRGTGETTGHYDSATTADFAQDALQAVAYLRSRADLKNATIGLIGHSEGGAAIAMAAARSSDVAFIISLSGLATNGLDALLEQNRVLVNSAPIPQRDKDRYHSLNDLLFHTVYDNAQSPELEQQLRAAYADWKVKDDKMMDSLKIQFDHFRFFQETYFRQATGPWYRYHIRFDPAPFMARIKVPVLAIYGDKDLMVNAASNAANWKRFTTANGQHTTTLVLPGINHLLQSCTTCTPQEYAQLPETIAPIVLTSINNWLNRL